MLCEPPTVDLREVVRECIHNEQFQRRCIGPKTLQSSMMVQFSVSHGGTKNTAPSKGNNAIAEQTVITGKYILCYAIGCVGHDRGLGKIHHHWPNN